MASQLIVAEKEYPFDIVILRHHVYKSVAFPFFMGFPKKSSLHCLCYTNHTTPRVLIVKLFIERLQYTLVQSTTIICRLV